MRPIRRLLISFGKNFLFRVRVTGESCWPMLMPGKSYWASALLLVHSGDFIVFKNRGRVLVKRVRALRKNGYEAESLISWGSSSGDIGIVEKKDVLGRIIGPHKL